MRGHAIAERYAKALFEIGLEAGEETLERFQEALEYLAAAVTDSAELAGILKSPMFTHSEKEQALSRVLDAAASGFSPAVMTTVKRFCGLLAEKNRLSLLTLIAQAYASMLDARTNTVRGELLTAIELDQTQRESIRQRLEQNAQGKLALEYRVDPAILGGMILKLGNRVLDASLLTQLETLRDTIKKGE